jgi:hypothetical protein
MKMVQREVELLLSIILSDRPVKTTMIALGFVVLAIIALYIATFGQPASSLGATIHHAIGLSRDRSMGEIVNYGLAFLASVLFFLVFIESRSIMVLSLSILMAFVWFDDAGRYHERFGGFLSREFNLPALPATRQQDTGELIAWAIAGIILALFFLSSLARRRPGDLCALALVSVGFVSLVLFGVFADMLHTAAPPAFDFIIGVIEDGGEMVAITCIAGIALGLARNHHSYQDLLSSTEQKE